MLPAPAKDQPPQLSAELEIKEFGLVRIEYALGKSSHGRMAPRWFWTAFRATAIERPSAAPTSAGLS
jgi:hypothetical protein